MLLCNSNCAFCGGASFQLWYGPCLIGVRLRWGEHRHFTVDMGSKASLAKQVLFYVSPR